MLNVIDRIDRRPSKIDGLREYDLPIRLISWTDQFTWDQNRNPAQDHARLWRLQVRHRYGFAESDIGIRSRIRRQHFFEVKEYFN